MTPSASQSHPVFSTRAATAFGLSALALLLAAPTQFGLAAPRDGSQEAGANRVDPAIHPAIHYAPTDAEPGADRLWTFPRLRAARLAIGERLVFTLPGARAIELPLVSRQQVTAGSLSLTFADGATGGSAEIAIHRGRVHGTVRATFGGRHESWTLATDGPTERYTETPRIPGCEGVLHERDAVGLAAAGDGGVAGLCNDSAQIIDVLVAYTPSVAASYATVTDLEAAITSAFTTANGALANSLAITRYRIVGFHPLATNGSGSVGTDLNALTDIADGVWDDVHAERDATGADLVQAITGNSGAGRAWIGAGNPSFGFSVCSAIDGLLTAHELGHNLRCCHAVGDGGGCENGGFFSFSNGWRFTANSAEYRTVMAYSPGVRIPYFSNPLVRYLNVPTGVAESSTNAGANNARTTGLLALVVANYRCAVALETDCDQDGIVDSDAIAAGTVPDCNLTGLPDSCDIEIGISVDLNLDGVPDDCPQSDVELSAGAVTPLDTYGTSVSISSRATDLSTSLVISGAPGNDTGATRAGAAYIHRLVNGQPVEQDFIQSSPPKANAYFGLGSTILRRPASASSPPYPARDFALVGAYRENETTGGGGFASKGALYCFADLNGTWTQVWRYTPATNFFNTRDYALFGFSSAMGRHPRESREQIIVGSPGQDNGRGRVFFLQNRPLNAGETSYTWNNPQTRLLTPVNASDQDNFGYSVALENSLNVANSAGTVNTQRVIAVAGAPGRNAARGAVIVYDRSFLPNRPDTIGSFPGGGIALTPPQADASAPGDRFGTSVAIEQNIIAVGAPNAKTGRGRVYFWERRTDVIPATLSAYVYRGFFEAPDSAEDDGLGTSVAVSRPNDAVGYIITVGAPGAAVVTPLGVREDAGKVYVLRKIPGETGASLIAIRTARTPATGDRFGSSLSGTWGITAIGAPFNDDLGLNAGKVRILSTP